MLFVLSLLLFLAVVCYSLLLPFLWRSVGILSIFTATMLPTHTNTCKAFVECQLSRNNYQVTTTSTTRATTGPSIRQSQNLWPDIFWVVFFFYFYFYFFFHLILFFFFGISFLVCNLSALACLWGNFCICCHAVFLAFCQSTTCGSHLLLLLLLINKHCIALSLEWIIVDNVGV